MRESSGAKFAASAYGQLVCDDQGNVGDDIQALAASLHLPRVDRTIDREQIHKHPGAGEVVIMNGWFSRDIEAWPPSPSIHPIFVSFHVQKRFKPTIAKYASYLKQFEPIGTRDRGTEEFLNSIGIKAETTYCLTLTFPERSSAPENGKVFIVDASSIAVPKHLRENAVKVSHVVAPIGHKVTMPYAQQLLDTYRDHASLVITTRLHCALPCIAMGIPVIYFGSRSDARTAIIEDIGGVIYDAKLHSKSWARGLFGKLIQPVDWSPQPLDVGHVKENLRGAVVERLRAVDIGVGATSAYR